MIRRAFLAELPWPQSGGGLFGHVPSRKHQEGGVAPQDARQCFAPFDSQIDDIVDNG